MSKNKNNNNNKNNYMFTVGTGSYKKTAQDLNNFDFGNHTFTGALNAVDNGDYKKMAHIIDLYHDRGDSEGLYNYMMTLVGRIRARNPGNPDIVIIYDNNDDTNFTKINEAETFKQSESTVAYDPSDPNNLAYNPVPSSDVHSEQTPGESSTAKSLIKKQGFYIYIAPPENNSAEGRAINYAQTGGFWHLARYADTGKKNEKLKQEFYGNAGLDDLSLMDDFNTRGVNGKDSGDANDKIGRLYAKANILRATGDTNKAQMLFTQANNLRKNINVDDNLVNYFMCIHILEFTKDMNQSLVTPELSEYITYARNYLNSSKTTHYTQFRASKMTNNRMPADYVNRRW